MTPRHELAGRVRTRDDLGDFIRALHQELVSKPKEWENNSLEHFLEALSAWVTDMDGYFTNQGETTPVTPTWQLIAQMLDAARTYE